MNRLRHDIDFVTTVALLVTVVATALTGVIADLWDLNDFWYHTVSGYAMGVFAAAHVVLNQDRLIAYGRFRWRSLRQPRPPAPVPVPLRRSVREGDVEPVRPASMLAGAVLSRRGLFGLTMGGIAGLAIGRGLRPAPPIEAGSDVGVIYHQWSKPGIIDALGSVANWGPPVDLYKRYPAAPVVELPEPDLNGGLPAATAIARRRSTRDYVPTPMTPGELSRLLYLTSGIAADKYGNARRTAPSSGALYPIEVYAVVHRVEGIEPGVYHYAYREHALEQVRIGDFRAHTVEQAISQDFLGECGVVLFLTMIMQRMRPKYQDRSYRYGLLEAGHLGENAYLAATSMGLGACGVGAFMDDAINEMLGVDGVEEAAVYMLAAGHVAAA
ncbi:MAG TPA: SagB family peptide dehydrogenase [Candidatus Limnocylindrales bacterium]|nr:SagB family peptide dehydrogenase [Candidatus Limnocylindrales bacterium]